MDWTTFCDQYWRQIYKGHVDGLDCAVLRLVADFGNSTGVRDPSESYADQFQAWALQSGVPHDDVVNYVERLLYMRKLYVSVAASG